MVFLLNFRTLLRTKRYLLPEIQALFYFYHLLERKRKTRIKLFTIHQKCANLTDFENAALNVTTVQAVITVSVLR